MLVELWKHQTHQLSQVLQVPVDVVVRWRANKYCALHEPNETPEGFRFVLQFTQNWSQKIAHALRVAELRKV